MNRYSVIEKKIPREIVLLKGRPCAWGKCSFCDYIDDNSTNEELNHNTNIEVLKNITGKYGVIEVINSGNIFELPKDTLVLIKDIIIKKNIHTLFFEAHWIYRKRVQSMRDYFGINCIVKTGLESFNKKFREQILVKGFSYKNIEEIKMYFDSVCLMPGIKGQTQKMIKQDIKLAMSNFKHFTVNVFIKNTTNIEPDPVLIKWFQDNYKWLDDEKKCDVLWINTDFGVGN
ncbi:MAG: hypothetical protein JXR64_08795 [Spirochaetales bacterium]|nr:hypothetical protein [Spirochaetales bacterium]